MLILYTVRKLGERTLLAAVKVFNQRFKIVFIDPHDPHFALRVLGGIGGVRRVNHDRLTEFLPDGTRRRFRRIGWAEYVTDFAYRVFTLINDRDTLFRSGFVALFRQSVARPRPGHELDDVLPSLTPFVRV